jgi:2-keto-4-pentenoate hydratase/2-oxohepta-3-ene-1,7-dioic acid hydratase in catechol pathway
MRLATARTPGGTALYAEAGGGWVSAARLGRPAYADVGELLRAGDAAVAELRAAATDPNRRFEPVPLESLTLAPPVLAPRSIVCVGRNYAAHAAEGGNELPSFPMLFAKFANALTGHGATVAHPTITSQLDYEGELAVVIGKPAYRVQAADALDHVAGFTVLNDLSARDLQKHDPQWVRAKSLDGFAPTGPVVVTADAAGPVDGLRVTTTVNGEKRQDQSCSDMVFKIPELIEFITGGLTLLPGDLIATGTPSGVGMGFDPPKWLAPGDLVEVTIPGIGTLATTIGPQPA